MKSGRKRRHPVLSMILLTALLLQLCIPASATEAETGQNTPPEGEMQTEQTASPEQEDTQTDLEAQAEQADTWPQGPEIASTIAILYDADSHILLYDKGAMDVRYPASTTKLLTALLAIENAPLDAQITMGENACREVTFDSSNINSIPGEVFTLDQCLHAILMSSANEISTQVAEYIGGSVEGFAEMMNQRAYSLGCVNTHFSNANGLHDPNHWTTAYDLALIMAECAKNETFCQIEESDIYVIPPTNMTPEKRAFQQHHVMLLNGSWAYEGVFGGKTGFTDEAGHTLVTACKRDGHTLIAVTMGGENPACFREAKALLDYGYQNFGIAHAVDENGEELEDYITVPLGKTIQDLDCSVQEKTSPRDTERSFQTVWTYAGKEVGSVTYTMPFVEETIEVSSSVSSEEPETITTEELLSGIGGDNSASNLSKAQNILAQAISALKKGIDIVGNIAAIIITEIRTGNPDSPILIFILADAAGILILIVAIFQQKRHRRKKLKKAREAKKAALTQESAQNQEPEVIPESLEKSVEEPIAGVEEFSEAEHAMDEAPVEAEPEMNEAPVEAEPEMDETPVEAEPTMNEIPEVKPMTDEVFVEGDPILDEVFSLDEPIIDEISVDDDCFDLDPSELDSPDTEPETSVFLKDLAASDDSVSPENSETDNSETDMEIVFDE